MSSALARPLGFQMIKSAEIKNFRGFEDVLLPDCRRINIVLGDNGSGKTALLEGLFLALGANPELVLRLRAFRGFEGKFAGSPKLVEDALWRDLFFRFEKKRPVSIFLQGTGTHTRGLNVSRQVTEQAIPLIETVTDKDQDIPLPLVFQYSGPDAPKDPIIPVFRGGELRIPHPVDLIVDSYFFPANHIYSAAETAARFSELSKRYKATDFVREFATEFGGVRDLNVEILAGTPMLYGGVDYLKERAPLSLISAGINKLVAILLAIPMQRGAVVLIDELENGIHHTRMPAVWRTFLKSCKDHDAQIFASTHSWECLQAAVPVIEANPDAFSVIHVSQTRDGSKVRVVPGENVSAAIESNIEIRS